ISAWLVGSEKGIRDRPRHGHRMELTHANGAALSAHEPLELAAGGMVNVEGCVRAPSGDIDTAFDGYGVVSVFDGRKKRAVVNGNASEKEGWTETDEDLIYEKCVRIEGGRFAGDMYLPAPSRMEGVERVSMCAVSDEGGISASGWFGGLSVMAGDSDAGLSDETAPEIVSMYLDHTGFSDGDVVGNSPVVYAEVAPCVIGVARMSTQVGKALSLSLDGGKTRYENVGSGFKADEHGGGKFRFSVSGLADGHHSLTLKVTNYAGQSASRTVRFTVVGREGACALSVAEYPAVTEANISVAHTFPSEPSGRIVVADAEGNVVFTDSEAMFPYCWKLTATDGTKVPEGIYEVRAYLRAGNVCGSADPVEVVVFRD
ncbi:MAG: hypothetical protein K2L78_04965, partial [Muribaculaceae bacterium]|nr:hypothetical protein [Muribaculaceae bacterium]